MMPVNQNDQAISRQSMRLRNHDYSNPGIYYFTLVTFRREHIFGKIEEGKMVLNEAGRILLKVWNEIPARYPAVSLLEAVVMPNHFHGMIRIKQEVNADREVADIVDLEVAAIHELPLQTQKELPSQEKMAKIQDEYRINRRRMLLPKVVGFIKMNSAKWINHLQDSRGTPVWQRNYYERIIRNKAEFHVLRKYICNNPLQWVSDEEYH